jgi:nucleoid-associated protein YgaU
MYFSTMPNIYYEFTDSDGKPTLKVLKDITTNVRVIRSVLENITVYDSYDIVDGETPEIIATKVYGNPLYHWVIMLANDKFDYREDFPLDYTSLVKRVEEFIWCNECLCNTPL